MYVPLLDKSSQQWNDELASIELTLVATGFSFKWKKSQEFMYSWEALSC